MTPSWWVIIFVCAMLPIWRKRRGAARCGGGGIGMICLVVLTVLFIAFTFKMASIRSLRVFVPPTIVTTPLATMAPATVPSGKWTDDWQAFVNSAPPGARWVRGESTLCGSEDDARHEATQDAANQIQQIIGRRFGRPNTGLTDQPLANQVARTIDNGQWHVEKTVKPYGDVWRAMILVDASDELLKANIIDPAIAVARVQTSHTISQAVATGAMLLVVILLYVFLNMATKGYFVWRLRAAAVMAVIVAMLAVLAWM